MHELPVSAQGSGEGMAPVAATGESSRKAAEQARAGEAGAPNPLTGAALWGAGFLLSLANFIVLLDPTIANVSVPNIAGGLGASRMPAPFRPLVAPLIIRRGLPGATEFGHRRRG